MTATLIFSIAALLCPPTIEELLLSNLFSRFSSRLRARPPVIRELSIWILALAFGLLALPWLIWATGNAVLGPYAHGGALHFFEDFFSGLAKGSDLFWLVAVGPALFLLLFRLLLTLLRAFSSESQRGQ
jgi:hypothetical protein